MPGLIALAACNTTPTGNSTDSASGDSTAASSSSTGATPTSTGPGPDITTSTSTDVGSGDGTDGTTGADSSTGSPPSLCPPALGWVEHSRGFPNQGSEQTTALAMSPQGVLTALYQSSGCEAGGTLDFGGDPMQLDMNSGADLVLVQYDPALGHRVTQAFGGDGNTYGEGLAVDDAGNVYIVGYFDDHLHVPETFGGANYWVAPPPDPATPPDPPHKAAFIAVFDASGARTFTAGLRSTGGDVMLYGVAVAPAGEFYVVGEYSGTLEADPVACPTIEGEDRRGLVVQAYPGIDGPAPAQPSWTRCSTDIDGEASITRLLAVTATAAGVVAAGDFSGAVALVDPEDGSTQIEALGAKQDALFVAWDAAGRHRWHRVCGSELDDQGYGVATDAAGNVVISGRVGDRQRCSDTKLHPGSSQSRAFVAGFDPAAEPDSWRFDRVFTPSGDSANVGSHLYEVNVSPCGEIVAAGFARGLAAFEDEAAESFKGSGPGGAEDILVVKLTADGDTIWGRRFQSAETDVALAVTTDPQGSIFVGGWYNGEVTGVGQAPWPAPTSCHIPSNNRDAFLLHLSP